MGYLYTILSTVGLTFIAGIGIHLLFSLAGIIFLGFPSAIKIGMYVIALSEKANVAPEIALLLGFAAALAIILLFAWIFVKVSLDSFVVIGLASVVATEALLRSWDSVTNGTLGISGISRPALLASLPSIAVVSIVLGLLCLLLEYVLLKTWVGRALRAYRESDLTLQAMGVHTSRFMQGIIFVAGFFFMLSFAIFLWRVQYLDPQMAGIPTLIEFSSIAILALKPKLRSIIFAVLIVELLPEMLRFLSLPAAVMGYVRGMLYAALLMFFLAKISGSLMTENRKL